MVQEVSGEGRVASQPGQIGLRPEPASSLGHSATVPSREERRYKSLASDHYHNARRLAHRLVAAEDELRALKLECGR